MNKVPNSLKQWFTVHFIADMLFALPLMVAPVWTLTLFGFPLVDPYTTRLVAAALFGIGGVSFLRKEAHIESYRTMLLLKIIWSGAAIVGLTWSLYDNYVPIAVVVLGIFVLFNVLWVHYYRRL